MNSVSGIFVAVSLIFGGGYAVNKIYQQVRSAATQHIHHGTPSLSFFTRRLTHAEIDENGKLVAFDGACLGGQTGCSNTTAAKRHLCEQDQLRSPSTFSHALTAHRAGQKAY